MNMKRGQLAEGITGILAVTTLFISLPFYKCPEAFFANSKNKAINFNSSTFIIF